MPPTHQILFLFVFFSVLFCAENFLSAQSWPGFLGPFGTSVSPEKGIKPWGPQGLRVVWQRDLGTGYGAPSIQHGNVYVFDRVGNRARLRCLSATSGEEKWSYDYPSFYRDQYGYNNGPRCCPVLDDERVYLYGADGELHCVRADTGKFVWKVDTLQEFNIVPNFFGVGSTPILEGDLLLVQVGGSPPGPAPREFQDVKSNGTGLVAFDKWTGKIVYRLGDELASYASPVLATINGRRWGFLMARGGLVGFEPTKGKLDFHFPWRADILESVNVSNPVVVGDRVFISETYGPGCALLKVRPGGYDVVWSEEQKSRKSLPCHWMTPIPVDGYLYGCAGRHKHSAQLRCIEWATGKVQWAEPDLTRCSLLLVDNHFVCLGEDGTLRLLRPNPKKYEELAVTKAIDPKTKQPLLEEPCWAAPVLVDGLLYIRGENRLVCLELIAKK